MIENCELQAEVVAGGGIAAEQGAVVVADTEPYAPAFGDALRKVVADLGQEAEVASGIVKRSAVGAVAFLKGSQQPVVETWHGVARAAEVEGIEAVVLHLNGSVGVIQR